MQALCSYCGKVFEMNCGNVFEMSGTGCFCPEHRGEKTRPDTLTKKQNINVLKNLRKYIIKHDLYYDDCDDIGDKYNICNWGMCTKSSEVWDRPEYHIWPFEFTKKGRVAPITRVIKCHFDIRTNFIPYGCFYTCIIFQNNVKPTKDKTLQMIDSILKENNKKGGKLCQ